MKIIYLKIYEKLFLKRLPICSFKGCVSDLSEKSEYYYDFYDDLGNIPVKQINTRDARIGIVQGDQTSTGRKLGNQNGPIKKPKYSAGIVFPSRK